MDNAQNANVRYANAEENEIWAHVRDAQVRSEIVARRRCKRRIGKCKGPRLQFFNEALRGAGRIVCNRIADMVQVAHCA